MSNCGMCQRPEGNPDCVFCKDKIPSVTIKYRELQHRSHNGKRGISFLPNHDAPFSGRAEDSFPNGQKKCDYKIKEGVIIEGKEWYQNGQLKWEQSSSKSISFFKDGVKRQVKTYTNGLVSDCSAWTERRQKCPHTKLENGNGVLVWWQKDINGLDEPGHAFAFKDGKEIDTWGLPGGNLGNFYHWLDKYRIRAPQSLSFLQKYKSILQILYGLLIPVVLYDLIGIELDFLKFRDFSLLQYLYCVLLIGLSWIGSLMLTSEHFYRKKIFKYNYNVTGYLFDLISCSRGWFFIFLAIVAYKHWPF